MRRRILNENKNIEWQAQQAAPKKKIVFVLTKFNGEEVQYDDFWEAVADAEDKYCIDANMVDSYFETVDDDGLHSYELAADYKPYEGHWTEEEGTQHEPTETYDEYVSRTGLTEASIFPSASSNRTNWIARTPTTAQANNNQAQASQASAAPTQQTTTTQQPTASAQQNTTAKSSGGYIKTPITNTERKNLMTAVSDEDGVLYALLIAKMYMDRLAVVCGLQLTDVAYNDFYDVIHGGLADLCQDVQDTGVWPTISEAEAYFTQRVGRTMTVNEKKHLTTVLGVLDRFIAPDGMCEVFLNAGDFCVLRADNWLDSECDDSDYEYAFNLGWNGKPEDDWYALCGGVYNQAAEYLEMAYSYGADSHSTLSKICTF